MARTDTLINFLTDVAAAIKDKKGDSTPIPAANFDTEIANLPSGGGGGGGDNTTLISLIDRTATSFEIPEGTTSIGNYAFRGCTGLTSVTIPDGVTSIGSWVFGGCAGLTSITIPDCVTSIGDSAFYNCTGLTSITIPDSVTSIGSNAFNKCTKLTEIDFSTHNAVPTLANTNAFDNTSASLVIKVPSALVDEWKAATNWATYSDKIVEV